jgi:hydroxymethylglutaryl-CoA lyase
MTDAVVLCECFARDGLQNEIVVQSTERKLELLARFVDIGFRRIEATSFTNSKNVAQFADAEEVLQKLPRQLGVRFKATCINMRSVDRALAMTARGCGPDEISVLLASSEASTRRAFNRSRAEQMAEVEKMIVAVGDRIAIIGNISTALGCFEEGAVDPGEVVARARQLHALGVRKIAIADTTGMGNPASVERLFGMLLDALPDVVAIAHFHDTRGAGLANCLAAYRSGVRHFDCAFGGAGGSPAKITYTEGHTGNVATEDLTTMFEGMGISTGLQLDRLLETAMFCEQTVGRELQGRVTRSGLGLVNGVKADV